MKIFPELVILEQSYNQILNHFEHLSYTWLVSAGKNTGLPLN